MIEPTHVITFTLSSGSAHFYCECQDEADKIKAAVLARRNDPAKKGDLFTYKRGDSEFSLFVSTIDCVSVTSMKEVYDLYYQRYYNERCVQDQVDELIFAQKYNHNVENKKTKDLPEVTIANSVRNLKRIETLNKICDSFANMVNILSDAAVSNASTLDPGVRVQFEQEISHIKQDLISISEENNG